MAVPVDNFAAQTRDCSQPLNETRPSRQPAEVLKILLLSVQIKADRPPWHLSIIAGALLRTLDLISSRSAEYMGFLIKGQLPPARLTLTSFEESIVLEGGAMPTIIIDHRHFSAHGSLGPNHA